MRWCSPAFDCVCGPKNPLYIKRQGDNVMRYEENPALLTLLRRAQQVAETLVGYLGGATDWQPRLEDYRREQAEAEAEADPDKRRRQRIEDEFGDEEMSARFQRRPAGRRRPGRCRQPQPHVQPASVPIDRHYPGTLAEVSEYEIRLWKDDLMRELSAVEANLKRHSRELYLDLEGWLRATYQPDVDDELRTTEESRFQALLDYINQLQDQSYVTERLRLISSAWSAGTSPYGRTDDAVRRRISALLLSDMEAMDARFAEPSDDLN